MQASFKEILEEKLKNSMESRSMPKGKSQFSDPFALSYLMGFVPQYRYSTGQYSQPKTHTDQKPSRAQQQSHYPPEDFYHEPVHEVSGLSVEALTAFYALKSLGANLQDTFSFTDLKKQYRSLLLRYHPDHNPVNKTPESFFELREAYDCLVSELVGT